MKIIKIIILILALPTISFGQKFDDSLIENLYNKTLLYYFTDSTLNTKEIKLTKIILQTDFDTTKIIKNVGPYQFKFIGKQFPLQSLLINPSGKNSLNIYDLYHRYLGQDTILITISISSLSDAGEYSDWTYSHFTISGNQTVAKFIHGRQLNTWTLINMEEIIGVRNPRRKK